MGRFVTFARHGGPEVLHVREVPDPRPGPGEVRVSVRAVALNPMDVQIVASAEVSAAFGLRAGTPVGFGTDFAGVIDEVGPSVTDWSVLSVVRSRTE